MEILNRLLFTKENQLVGFSWCLLATMQLIIAKIVDRNTNNMIYLSLIA